MIELPRRDPTAVAMDSEYIGIIREVCQQVGADDGFIDDAVKTALWLAFCEGAHSMPAKRGESASWRRFKLWYERGVRRAA